MRARRAITCTVAVAVILIGTTASEACTGFAAYDERPLYGMNFDYASQFPMKLFVDTSREPGSDAVEPGDELPLPSARTHVAGPRSVVVLVGR